MSLIRQIWLLLLVTLLMAFFGSFAVWMLSARGYLETLGKGQGDCEDFAIGKYFSLLAAGVPSVKMRLVYVRAQIGALIQAHMVLAYYPEPDAEPLILDNLITDIRPASRRPDLIPVFSFNAEGLWQGVAGASAGDPSARLSRWREVLTKAKAEGWW